ncbi:ABC transporter permease, partial [candidate division KSB1 bacterium]
LHQIIEPMVFQINPEFINYLSIKVNPGQISSIINFIENTWYKFTPNVPFEYDFLDKQFDNQYQSDIKIRDIFLYFTTIGIFVACLGLFGLASFSSEQRTKEIGIRKVLGASVPGIISLLSRDFIKLVLVSNIFAWPAAYYTVNKWLQNYAYKTDITIWSFIVSSIIAVIIALLTVIYQSIRAATADPVTSLRQE